MIKHLFKQIMQVSAQNFRDLKVKLLQINYNSYAKQGCIYLIKKMHNQIRMLSKGSRGTEDWSNDAENSTVPSQE